MTPRTPPASAVWTRHGLLCRPPPGHPRWVSHAQAPTVLVLSPRCWRIYVGGRDGSNRSHIYYFDVDPGEGMRVLRVHDVPLLECGAPGSFDVHGMGPATALRVGTQVWLYYSGISLRHDVPYQVAVGLAVSDDDGHSFRRASAGPVLTTGPSDPYFVTTPCVWREGDRFRAMYSSATGWVHEEGRWECCYDLRTATSDDGLNWRADADSAMALAAGEAGLVRPWRLPAADGQHMWFSRRGLQRFREAQGETYRVQHARSVDGRHWQRDNVALAWSPEPAPEDWDGWMQAYACVLPHEDRWVMFYNGNHFGRDGLGWASAPRGSDATR